MNGKYRSEWGHWELIDRRVCAQFARWSVWCPRNGQSLTRPAVVKGFLHLFLTYWSLFFSFLRTPMRSRRNLLSLARSFVLSHVHPARSVPCRFITSVLPTNHLFDHCGP